MSVGGAGGCGRTDEVASLALDRGRCEVRERRLLGEVLTTVLLRRQSAVNSQRSAAVGGGQQRRRRRRRQILATRSSAQTAERPRNSDSNRPNCTNRGLLGGGALTSETDATQASNSLWKPGTQQNPPPSALVSSR